MIENPVISFSRPDNRQKVQNLNYIYQTQCHRGASLVLGMDENTKLLIIYSVGHKISVYLSLYFCKGK